MTDATASTAPAALAQRASPSAAAIADFAAAVRAQLGDLPTDDVDDLADGLEADLTEQAADAADGAAVGAASPELGNPVAYAAELRAAADLPPRSEPGTGVKREPLLRWLGARARSARADAARSIRLSPAGAQLLDFLLVLRPLWWVLRGWAVYVVAGIAFAQSLDFFPINPIEGFALVAFVTLSVQWGRGRWLPWRWLSGFRTLVSVCAILALPWLLIGATHQVTSQNNQAYDNSITSPGLVQNGEQVTNVFAYDANGQPLSDVQLFDQHGNPLTVANDSSGTPFLPQYDAAGNQSRLVPSLAVPGGSGWNVYPLHTVSAEDIDSSLDYLGQADQADAEPTMFPFARVQSLVAVPEEGELTPSPTPSAEPTASATDVPVPTPSLTDAGAPQ